MADQIESYGGPDHPRVSGEHGESKLFTNRHGGSSPRERGALRGGVTGVLQRGIIPA